MTGLAQTRSIRAATPQDPDGDRVARTMARWTVSHPSNLATSRIGPSAERMTTAPDAPGSMEMIVRCIIGGSTAARSR